MAVDYAKIPLGGNRVGLHYSRFCLPSNERARAFSTGYAVKISWPEVESAKSG